MPRIPPTCSQRMHILYIGPFAQPTEDGRLAHEIMLAIHREGISLEIVPTADCNSDALDEKYQELVPLARGCQDGDSPEVTHRIIHADPWEAETIIREEQAKLARWPSSEDGLGYDEIDWNGGEMYSFQMIIVSQDAQTFRLDELWKQQRSFHELSPFHCIMLTAGQLYSDGSYQREHPFWTDWKMTGNLRQLQRNLNKIVELRYPSDVIRVLNEAHGNLGLL